MPATHRRGRTQRSLADAGDPLDWLRALVLMADALREGEQARAVSTPPPRDWQRSGVRTPGPVEVSVLNNRLYSAMRGFCDVPQAEALLAGIRAAVPHLRPGFDVISDVSRLGTVAPSAYPGLRKAATALVEAGMGQMVRVVGSAREASETVARVTGGIYVARLVASVAEAERLLGPSVSSPGPEVPPSPRVRPTARRRGSSRTGAGPDRRPRRPR